MALAREATMANNLNRQKNREQIAVPISLNTISPLVAILDFGWIVLLGTAAGLAYHAAALEGNGEISNYIGSGIAVAALYSVFAHAAQLYRASNLLRIRWQVGRSILVWLTTFVFLASLVFILKIGATFSRGAMLAFFTSGLFANAIVRFIVARVCTYVIASNILKPNRVILIGVENDFGSHRATSALECCGYAVVGEFSLPIGPNQTITKKALRSLLREVVRYVRDARVDEVVVAIPWDKQDVIDEIECELRVLPLPVKLVPDDMTERMLRRPVFELGPTKVVELQRAPLSATQRNLKRTMDQICAALGLLLLLPLFGVIAVAIRLETPGPAMFFQTRVGFNGRPFKICKFRTMSTQDDGPIVVQATRNDKRITRLGNLLRRLSIDEVPQLLNVLRGEMSLVGPRPHALAHDNEYDRLIATYAIRHKIKPGITGWAQVNGFRGETPELGMMRQRVENDIWYIEYWSLGLDIRILLLTIARVLKSDNAY
ncbi:undecaprenyl-phosphate glucose phosphotransferase [Pseudorhodoplanes sinuspersici]|uniref:Undecaprenyl-phosphate glucose phosphotransferase n=1 Tax=Pseudorhodoplanes sinuspersici TaxID=1235591 RepID=A0A1W6ZQ39_9HYPH|nr:undecaprenyl-phosphate glucose phosphotransferase [Pseudorhodoplanes sinuspersici]ARP99513.1 undecaprenyl-phosphate glucose phosphotransferase [Pseudorhodoplanes sinuspersici]RKE70472.1 putative colanic acid biosynthesis UDP-glucose lipid carrier transferase [Pseudorhodoplanes sinuspersici]